MPAGQRSGSPGCHIPPGGHQWIREVAGRTARASTQGSPHSVEAASKASLTRWASRWGVFALTRPPLPRRPRRPPLSPRPLCDPPRRVSPLPDHPSPPGRARAGRVARAHGQLKALKAELEELEDLARRAAGHVAIGIPQRRATGRRRAMSRSRRDAPSRRPGARSSTRPIMSCADCGGWTPISSTTRRCG